MTTIETNDFKSSFDFFRDGDDLESIYNRYGGVGSLKIDVGCGFNKMSGFVGLDNLSGRLAQIEDHQHAPDILIDLHREQFPFPSNSATEVLTSHYLEHSHVDHTILEAYRLLKPQGIFKIIVPYANSAEGMYPGHTIFFTEKWFELNFVFQKHFIIEKLEFAESDYWKSAPKFLKDNLTFDDARKLLFNVCNEMTLTARSKKT